MAGEGYYRSDGLQNSGTALQYGGGNVYIFSGANFLQIYPREVVETLGGGSFGTWNLTLYQGSPRNWSQSGVAKQGAKSIGTTTRRGYECYGHIAPTNIPRYNNLLSVEYVKIRYKRNGGQGIASSNRTISFNVCTDRNNIPNMIYRANIPFPAGSSKVFLERDSNQNPELNTLFYHLIRSGQELCIFNGETELQMIRYEDGTGYGSLNYLGILAFEVMEIRLKYQP